MAWDPAQYSRFAAERAQPFHDLLALVERDAPIRRAVDLGCGPGELTIHAAQELDVDVMVGIDNSSQMLADARAHGSAKVEFVDGDIATWTSNADHDLVLAAASLQWVPDHGEVLVRWTSALAPGGQLTVQVPANAWMPSHVIADEVAHRPEHLEAFGADGPPPDPVARNVLEPETYAQLLFDLGFERQHVRLQVYGHVLADSREVVEWVKGTSLTRFRSRMADEAYDRFLADYEHALLALIGRHSPHFFPFRRILFWARKPR